MLSLTGAAAMRTAAEWVSEGSVVALTGAGISVESGIPDFRSQGGLWERFDPMDYATLPAFIANPSRVWELFRAVDEVISSAEPNPAHVALAELEAAGLVAGVLTQNIDSLHQRAGSRRVVEYHGGSEALHCVACRARFNRTGVEPNDDGVPYCPACGHALKPTVVLFGEMIPEDAAAEAHALLERAETLLVVGTSAEVQPFSELPPQCKRAGKRIVEINVRSSALTNRYTDAFLQGPAGTMLPELRAAVKARVGR